MEWDPDSGETYVEPPDERLDLVLISHVADVTFGDRVVLGHRV